MEDSQLKRFHLKKLLEMNKIGTRFNCLTWVDLDTNSGRALRALEPLVQNLIEFQNIKLNDKQPFVRY
jgi:hypothetical protein